MKAIKKLMAALLAVAMLCAIAVPAFADDSAPKAAAATYTVTIDNPVGSYEAYQIFSGRLDEATLSDVQWGTGVTAAGQAALGKAAERAEALATANTAAAAKAFAKEVNAYLSNTKYESNAYTAGAATTTISNLPAGYYLIKNKANSVGEDNVYTDFIVAVVKDTQVSPKGDKPTLDKEIKHNENNTWGVVGDNQIGETVEFRTITTVPNTAGYDKYDYTIYDTMSEGLTSNVHTNDDVVIKTKTADGDVLDSNYYMVTVDVANSNKFTVKIDILNAVKDGKIAADDSLYTYYTGVLNENAKIYNKNQNNEAHLEYSNNPNDDSSHGKTPDKKVYDWTYQMEVNKVDGKNNNTIDGAKFVLSRQNFTMGAVDEDSGLPIDTSNLIKLIANADGSYTIAPANYTGTTTYVMTAGKITIKGLDDAVDYYLYETKAPSSYNRVTEPTKIKIEASYNTDSSAANAPKISVNGAESTTDMKVTIENNVGATLPTTGGIGTTIFYIIGGGLMVAAVVLLITKKRMEKNN